MPIVESIMASVLRVSLRFIDVFEPLTPSLASYYMSQQLKKLKDEGLIENYKTHGKRLGKFFYRLDIDLDITASQVQYVLDRISYLGSRFAARPDEYMQNREFQESLIGNLLPGDLIPRQVIGVMRFARRWLGG